jgi:16S rRNA (cytidine1402-2'-O)-methyltransferase
MNKKTGKLYLIPSFLSETNTKENFPDVNLEFILKLEVFVVENLRTARRFLRKIGYDKNFDDVQFFELNKHTESAQIKSFTLPLINGQNVGLLSEAGTPCIADPGAEIVKIAQAMKIDVIPLTGPSSIILSLMASGFNGQQFVFHGYLPIDKKERFLKIRDMESNAYKLDQTQIFIETPYRNNQLFQSLLEACNDETLICIAINITHNEAESIKTKSVKEWRKENLNLHKKPAVFLLYR